MKSIMLILFLNIYIFLGRMQETNNIDYVIIYQSFLKAGTRSTIEHAFKNPMLWKGVLNTNKDSLTLTPKEFSEIIKNADINKWINPKIGGIVIAGEFKSDNLKHYFVICKPNIIIDFTLKKSYIITNKDDKEKLIKIINSKVYYY